MRSGIIAFLALLLAVFVAGGVIALLPACGIIAPWFGRVGFCGDSGAAASEQRLRALGAEHAALSRQVAALERELGALQCTREEPAAAPPIVPPVVPPVEPAIDAEAWDSGDIGLLEGCWALDSAFQTTHMATGVTTDYSSWSMCFDAAGAGQEELRSDTGETCAGPVTASFDASGALVIEEPGDLQCGDGAFIYRMINRCALNADGTATCELRQPELRDSGGTVSFRRAPREN